MAALGEGGTPTRNERQGGEGQASLGEMHLAKLSHACDRCKSIAILACMRVVGYSVPLANRKETCQAPTKN
jgi:hypothetical protein